MPGTSTTYYWQFSEILNTWLEEDGRSRANLAAKISVSANTVSRWINEGTRPESPDVIVMIAAMLYRNKTECEMALKAAGYYSSLEQLKDDPTTKEEAKKAISKILRLSALSDEPQKDEQDAKLTVRLEGKIDSLTNVVLRSARQFENKNVNSQIDLNQALSLLEYLPTETIPSIKTLPEGSRMPFSINPYFVGREMELKRVAAALKEASTVAIAAATGVGGIGKTQLAVEFVHRYGQFFVGGVHWMSFSDEDSVPSEIVSCGITMPELRTSLDTYDIEEQVKLVLSAWQSPIPRLLIFDNCEDPRLLEQWRPKTGGCRVLVTSRRQEWDALFNLKSIVLETLNRTQSIDLLRKFLPKFDHSDPFLDQIAAELGDLPLALHLAGNHLKRYRYEITPEHYLTQIRSPSLLQHHSLQQGDLSPTSHEQHVARTFAFSYERLSPIDSIDSLAISLLERASWFAPSQIIPRSLLFNTVKLESEESRLHAADSLNRLSELGLVKIELDGAIVLHRLITQFTQQVDIRASDIARYEVAVALKNDANGLIRSRLIKPLMLWQMHLQNIVDVYAKQDTELAAELCSSLGLYLQMSGRLSSAKLYLERSMKILEIVLGNRHSDTAACYTNLGLLLLEIGDLALARSFLEQAVAVHETVHDRNHPELAFSYNGLGMVLHALGDFSNALKYLKKALVIRESTLDEMHRDILDSYSNVGLLLKLTGDLAGAKPYLERSAKITEEIYGPDHLDTAVSYNNLGLLCKDMEDLEGAETYLEQAKTIYESLYDTHHPQIATVYNNLGVVHLTARNYPDAKSYLERCIAIREEILGKNHVDIATTYDSLGTLLCDTGSNIEGQMYLDRALKIRENAFGSNHPSTALSYNNLGIYFYRMGDHHKAKAYLERALQIFEIYLGPSHPSTLIVRGTLMAIHNAEADLLSRIKGYIIALVKRGNTRQQKYR